MGLIRPMLKLPIMSKLTECAKYALCQFFVTDVDTSEEDYFATGVSIVRRDINKTRRP